MGQLYEMEARGDALVRRIDQPVDAHGRLCRAVACAITRCGMVPRQVGRNEGGRGRERGRERAEEHEAERERHVEIGQLCEVR